MRTNRINRRVRAAIRRTMNEVLRHEQDNIIRLVRSVTDGPPSFRGDPPSWAVVPGHTVIRLWPDGSAHPWTTPESLIPADIWGRLYSSNPPPLPRSLRGKLRPRRAR